MMLCAATASASASREEASHSCRQIWWAAAWASSVRAAMDVATANVPEIASDRNANRPVRGEAPGFSRSVATEI